MNGTSTYRSIRYDKQKLFILIDCNEYICIYKRQDRWYHKFYKDYYFSIAPSSKVYKFTRRNLKKVYEGTNFEFLITHYNRLNKTLILEDREPYQSPICRLMNNAVSDAQYYKIALGLEEVNSKVGSS